MKHIGIVAGITFKEGLRNRAMLGILFFAVVMCALNFIITTSFTRELGKVAVDVGLSTVSISGLAIIFFLGMPLLSKDLDKLTVYMILARPIPRSAYILGKFSGLGLLVLMSVLILSVLSGVTVKIIMMLNPHYVPALFSWTFFSYAVFLSLMALLIVTAFSVLFTCVSTSSFIAFVLTAGTYLIGHNVELVKTLVRQTYPDGGVTVWIIDLASWVFPNLSAFDKKTAAAYGLTIPLGDVIISGFYGIVYVSCVLFLTVIVFNKKELS
ncbi:ABC transporter permease subunit [Desulfatiferula olefinivorans]